MSCKKQQKNRGINANRILNLKNTRPNGVRFYKDLVEGTRLTEEHVAIIREVEAEMTAVNSTNGDKQRKKKTLAQHQSFIKEKRLKIRQALNDDALFLQYDEFNRNYLKNRRKGNKKK